MPSPSSFLRGFNLKRGVSIGGGWKIEKTSIQHKVIERYKKYEFPMKISLVSKNNTSSAKEYLHHFTSHSKIINSQYGNPYRCTIGFFFLKNIFIEKKGKWTIYSKSNDRGVTRVVLKAKGVGIRKR